MQEDDRLHHEAQIIVVLAASPVPLNAETISDQTGLDLGYLCSLLASLVYCGPIVALKREQICHDCGHGRDAELTYKLNEYRCAECGEYWPCSDSKRRDLRPSIAALHSRKRSVS